jgi:hypothetical protein
MAFPDNKNYTLPSGEVYFGRFAEGTRVVEAGGDKYLGNTPELTLTADSDTLDHYDADAASRYKDDSVTLEQNRTGTLTCDHISPELLAWMFGGVASVTDQLVLTGVDETITAAKKGVRYQIGRTLANPGGVQGLTSLTAETDAGTPVPLVINVDYRVDLETGGIIFLPASTVVVDAGTTNVVLTYSATATEYHTVVSGENSMVEGRLVYIARQNKGAKFNYTMPYVTLRPDGDFALKSSDEWQVASFALEVLKLDDQTAQVYINGRPGAFI